ncbi:general secretion pathway protein K [Oryzisolibacter propanilivorax]|uniref:Type II secretion system protein K n=1 Tax=Oryzisolibacter propanilivorax TaxID=1527607 RepID=A0A1G9VBF7_9BURK|nr:type II secretion system minor pseudopilin GspK [Oryzisolibacter propanilivorax]SDM69400.1 general secretion pathway protein K [Oryzisolibacter propanilivorax]
MWRQAGAALLAAMLTVTLVASFAAAALWQQWRATEVEAAERARIQSAWILVGALDWSRLILREDALARSGDGTDNLTEPWSVPLAEARLSTFLAAQRGVAQVQDASTDTADAFLSGQISDQQALLNLRNLVQDDAVDAVAYQQFARLFDYLGLSGAELDALARQLQQALQPDAPASAPLLPQSAAQLTWWGLPPASAARLTPYVTLLPARTPVNLNTADAVVLWASADGLSMAQAQQLVQAREAQHFKSEADAMRLLGTPRAGSNGITTATHAVSSRYFEVRGRLRLEGSTVEERSLVLKEGGQARTLWRERGALPPAGAPQAGPYNAAPTRP